MRSELLDSDGRPVDLSVPVEPGWYWIAAESEGSAHE